MQGVLLAAGSSQRLRPVSLAIPKCLMPVCWNDSENRCELMVERLVSQMKFVGVEDIIVVVGHLKDAIMNFLGDGHRFNVAFTYLYQETLLGEADGLYLARRLLKDTFIVADADNFIDLPDVFLCLLERHRTSQALVTIGVSRVLDARQYAIVKVDEKFGVEDLLEKPNHTSYWSNLAKTGLYVIDPTVLDIDRKYSLSSAGEYTTTELFKYLASQKKGVAAEILEALYTDIGSWVGYRYVLSNLNLAKLAGSYDVQGKYEQAEPVYQPALKNNNELQHSVLAADLNSLGTLYYTQGKYEQAELLYQWVLALCEQQLEPRHPEIASSLNNLAGLYRAQGSYEQAEPLYRRALSIREQQLGPEHPETVISLNSLAGLYYAHGKYAEAEPLYQRALSICEQQLGPEHPKTASSLNNLAGLYRARGSYEQAEPLYRRALSIREQQLGPKHPETVISLNNLALLYYAQGRYIEAEPLYQRALSICEQQLGPEHPETASSLNNLAGIYQAQGKYAEAEPLYQRALIIDEAFQ